MNKNRKTSHILNVFQFDANGHVILPATLTIGENPHSSDNTSKIPSTSWIRTYVTGLSYLTGNQSITVSGDATGSGTTAITLTLANTAVTPGTYGSTTLVPVVTVDSKGRITSVTTAAISGSLTFTGDVTGSGTTGTSTGLTLAASGVTAGTYTKVTVDSKGRVTVGANASTTDISEGTNLYYTDARVGTYLTANSYATQSYVGTQIANLVASAPATLDTLNELSVALGNDPNFATSVATSIGTKEPVITAGTTTQYWRGDKTWQTLPIYTLSGLGGQPQLNGTGFVKASGTTISYDNSTYLTTSVASSTYVPYTGATGTVNLGVYDIKSNSVLLEGNGVQGGSINFKQTAGVNISGSGYTSIGASGTDGIAIHYGGASVSIILKNNLLTAQRAFSFPNSDGTLALTSNIPTNNNQLTNGAGYITGITSSNVTTALGYTPYNSTNPSGYITGITSSNVTTALGYTPYNSTNPSGYISSYTETDTLASVTGRGASTSTAITFNSSVTFAADKYQNPNSEYAIDLRNSDVIGINAFYFNDNAESSGEGINFWRSAGYWDTLRSEGGVLYYAPNRATLSASTGFIVYHSGNLTNLNQLTNGPGYVTTSGLSTDADSEQTVGGKAYHFNSGAGRINLDPRWNESGYDADLGCLHLWSWTAAGVAYGRAGIAFYNGSAYQYLTTKASTTGLFVNNTQVVTNSGTWGISISGNAATSTIFNNGSLYVSTVNGNTLNSGFSNAGDSSDIWINYRGYNDAQSYFRDFRVGDGKGAQVALFTGSNKSLAITGAISASNLSGTNTGDQTNISGNAATASSVAWSGVSSGYRENYALGFRPSDNSSSYAGFQFASPGNDSNAGYFLVRGGADNDVYTQNGLTIVADLGWLTLAQRTTASKGVRIMTGAATSVTRVTVTDATTTINNVLTASSTVNIDGSLRFQSADDRRLYGASVGAGYNCVRVQGNWNTFDIMGRVIDWTGSNLHFGNGYNGEDHSSYYAVLGNPVSYFKVEGPIYATGDIVAYYSDRRLKQNIQPIDSALDILNKIGTYTFEWNKKSEDVWAKKEGDQDFGLISQEVEAVWPLGVAIQGGKDINDKYDYGNPESKYYDPLHVEKNPEEYKTVRYDKMVTIAIAAIKEQQLQIEDLKRQINYLVENK